MTDKNLPLRIGLLVYAKSQVNTFLNSGSFQNLAENLNTQLIYLNETLKSDFSNSNISSFILCDPGIIIRKYSGFMQMLSLWKYRNRSMNQTVRAMASFGNRKQRENWNCVVVSEMNISPIKRYIVKIGSLGPLYKILRLIEVVLRNVILYPRWKNKLNKFDLLIIPFSGHIAMEFGSLVWIASRLRIHSLAVQENWDNLSTKTFITDEPDYFAVWGEQSAGHVRSVHRLFKTKVRIVGSARFSPYLNNNIGVPLVSNYDGRDVELRQSFILIGGTGDGEDDVLLINASFNAIYELDIQERPLVVYRPHPFTRTLRDHKELNSNFPELLIDSGPKSREFGHHNRLVMSCRILVNHFSTLSIEGLLSNVNVCVPLFLGRKSARYRYYHILNEWHHMMGLALIPQLLMPKNEIDLKKNIKLGLKTSPNTLPANIGWICEKVDWSISMKEVIKEISAGLF